LGNSGTIHFVQNENRPVRACVFTKKGIQAILLKQYSNNDLVAVRVKTIIDGNVEIFICCSAYLPYEGAAPTNELRRLVDFSITTGIPLLVGCDANSHNLYGEAQIPTHEVKLFSNF
jgi:hypothetical protein